MLCCSFVPRVDHHDNVEDLDVFLLPQPSFYVVVVVVVCFWRVFGCSCFRVFVRVLLLASLSSSGSRCFVGGVCGADRLHGLRCCVAQQRIIRPCSPLLFSGFVGALLNTSSTEIPMEAAGLTPEELFGAQERINANIRKAFDMVLSGRGVQRPAFTEETRFVGLEYALQFYETVRVRTVRVMCRCVKLESCLLQVVATHCCTRVLRSRAVAVSQRRSRALIRVLFCCPS